MWDLSSHGYILASYFYAFDTSLLDSYEKSVEAQIQVINLKRNLQIFLPKIGGLTSDTIIDWEKEHKNLKWEF